MSEREQQSGYIFLSGALMHPTLVLERWPDARFIARAWISADVAPVAEAFAGSLPEQVWGILLSIPEVPALTVAVTTDDGRAFTAGLGEETLAAGGPYEALAAARYWELPPAYVAAMMEALGAGEEEPRDDAVMG